MALLHLIEFQRLLVQVNYIEENLGVLEMHRYHFFFRCFFSISCPTSIICPSVHYSSIHQSKDLLGFFDFFFLMRKTVNTGKVVILYSFFYLILQFDYSSTIKKKNTRIKPQSWIYMSIIIQVPLLHRDDVVCRGQIRHRAHGRVQSRPAWGSRM